MNTWLKISYAYFIRISFRVRHSYGNSKQYWKDFKCHYLAIYNKTDYLACAAQIYLFMGRIIVKIHLNNLSSWDVNDATTTSWQLPLNEIKWLWWSNDVMRHNKVCGSGRLRGCVCVCVCVRPGHVHDVPVTHHPFKLGSITKFGPGMQSTLVKIHSKANLTWNSKFHDALFHHQGK